MPLIARPIRLGARSRTAADALTALAAPVGEGAVIGARSSVFRNVESWAVAAGNPARFIKRTPVSGRVGTGDCPERNSTAMNPKIAAIILTKNEERDLLRLLGEPAERL